ncbi:MAG: AmmeMemoRadiSam system protein B [bacterium]
MSIVFSAVLPHSPILIPNVGKENREKLKQTATAYEKLAEELVEADVETIVVISSQGLKLKEAFAINIAVEFDCRFEEFADLITKLVVSGDVNLGQQIKSNLETKARVQIISEEVLDYGSAIPFYLLAQKAPKIKILPIYTSNLGLQEHYEFGKLLKHELNLTERKIAVIASADLSHKLSEDSPAGYSPRAKKFDQKIIDCLTKDKTQDILNLDPELLKEVDESCSKSIAMLIGVMNDLKKTAKLMSYEAPFGVGYAVIKYEL